MPPYLYSNQRFLAQLILSEDLSSYTTKKPLEETLPRLPPHLPLFHWQRPLHSSAPLHGKISRANSLASVPRPSSPSSGTHLHPGFCPTPPPKLPVVRATDNLHAAESSHQSSSLTDPSAALHTPSLTLSGHNSLLCSTTSLTVHHQSLCWLLLSFPVSKTWGLDLFSPTLF